MNLRKAISLGMLVSMLSSGLLLAQTPTSDVARKAREEHAIEEIRTNQLTYSRRCGWIDWGHAGGDGPKSLIDAVLNETPTPISEGDRLEIESYAKERNIKLQEYTPVAYYQAMEKQSLGTIIKVGTKGVYLVKKGLQRSTREGVAWRIFKEVSEQSEQMQGSPPYSLLPSTAASSYGIGDLTGDKIAFYSNLKRYSRMQIERLCQGYTAQQSMDEFGRQGNDPKWQEEWRSLPQLASVPRIPRGIVLTVIKDRKFLGDYK